MVVLALLLHLLEIACDVKIDDLGWFRPIGCFRHHYVTIAVSVGFRGIHRCMGHRLIEALIDVDAVVKVCLSGGDYN